MRRSGPERGIDDVQLTPCPAFLHDIGNTKILKDGFSDIVARFDPQEFNTHAVPQVKVDIGNYFGSTDGFISRTGAASTIVHGSATGRVPVCT